MNEPQQQKVHLDVGRKVAIQADSVFGRFSANGVVSEVGNYAFRVKCNHTLSSDELEPGQEVRISLTDQKGILPITTQFVRIPQETPHVIILRLPTAHWRKNRRAFFRGEIGLPVLLINAKGVRLEGHTANLSGGGALLLVDSYFKIGDELQVVLQIEGKENIGARARVVWANYEVEPRRYGVRFLDLKARDQNLICRMVMVQEFEQRRAAIRELNERSAIR